MRALCKGLLVLLAASALGCKDPQQEADQQRLQSAQQMLVQGKKLLADGGTDEAIKDFKLASSIIPTDPTPYLLIAHAQKEAGNDAAAVLAIKQAELLGQSSPSIQRQLADLYLRAGAPEDAIRTWVALRDANQLTDAEIRSLAQLQAHQGHIDDAYKTLSVIQLKRPDDPEAKVVEAEILLLSGKELNATQIMDRLLTDNPNLLSARLLRARYFFNNGYPQMTVADLAQVTGSAAQDPALLQLEARALIALQRYDEAEKVLEPLREKDPRDVEVLSELAEVQLDLGKASQAQALIDQALAILPRDARALYVKGRIDEAAGQLDPAAEAYDNALASDPNFAPALSRIWRIQAKAGEKTKEMASLERLFFLNEASIEEKATLAGLYADSQVDLDRGRQLIDEALRRDPDNAQYKAIKVAIGKKRAKSAGPKLPMVIRGGHR